MRVTIVCGANPERVGDFFHSLAGRLQERGHAVWLVRWNVRPGRSLAVPPGVRELTFPSKRPNRFKDVLFLLRVFRAEKMDCVLATHAGLTAAAVAGYLTRVPLRCGWFHTTMGGFILEATHGAARLILILLKRRLIYATLTHVVAVSAACEKDLIERWRVSRRKVIVVPNSIRRAPDDLTGLDRDPAKIVCVARLVRSKGHRVLLGAIAQIAGQFPEVRCHLFGDGPERSALEGIAAELGISEHVVFEGAVPQERVIREMATAAVAVLPSLDEAFGLVVVEAMSLETPVVASRVGGIVEIVRDGVDGFLVKPGDAGELAKALVRLLGDEHLRKRLGRNARVRFAEEFELGKRTERFAEWLEQRGASVKIKAFAS